MMKSFKEVIVSCLKFLVENLTVVASIIASTYIIIASQIRPFSVTTLLLWIISLLGLIAISIVSEKFFKLNKIYKNTTQIKKSLFHAEKNIDMVMSARKDLDSFEERLDSARTIFISGGSLGRLSDEYYGFFQAKLAKGCKLEIVLIKPFSHSAELLCRNVVYEINDVRDYSLKIIDSLKRFYRLKNEFPNRVSVWISEQVPPFSILAKNIGEADAKIRVEFYTYAVPTRERISCCFTKRSEKT